MNANRFRRILGAAALALGAGVAAGCGAGPVVDLGPAVTLSETGGSRPTVAVDPRSGTALVAWVGTATGEADVYLARIEPGANEPSVVRVNDRPGDAAPHDQAPAQVAIGPEGNVYVVWQNNTRIEGRRFPASDLRIARSTDGGRSFEPAVTVNDDAGGIPSSHTFHDLAVGADGTVFVSWIDSRERDWQRAARPNPAGEVGPGHAHGEDGLPGPEIRIARSTDGGRSFGPGRVVDRESCPCCRTALALGADGAVYVAWRKLFDGNVRDIVVARADGDGEFGPPIRVHADDWRIEACPHAGPALAVDNLGRVHVAWFTGTEARPGLFYAASEDGGRTFGRPAALVVGEWVPTSQVRLAADRAGDGVWAAWEDRRGESHSIVLARVQTGRARGAARLSVAGVAPALAAVPGIRALAWLDGEAVRVRIGRDRAAAAQGRGSGVSPGRDDGVH